MFEITRGVVVERHSQGKAERKHPLVFCLRSIVVLIEFASPQSLVGGSTSKVPWIKKSICDVQNHVLYPHSDTYIHPTVFLDNTSLFASLYP